jgi:hypothetical protein
MSGLDHPSSQPNIPRMPCLPHPLHGQGWPRETLPLDLIFAF